MSAQTPPISKLEFVTLLAFLSATTAFSIDAILPAFGEIQRELSPHAPNNVQLVLTTFIAGMGIGTLITGPLSDSFGRKPILLWTTLLYIFGAVLAWLSSSIELLLCARFIQGLGASGARVISTTIIRDVYSGPKMAKVVSLVMTVFALAPALAPSIGYYIIQAFGWRSIFLSFILFSSLSVLWLSFRLSETLPKSKRLPFNVHSIKSAIIFMFAHPTARLCIIIQTLTFAMLFTVLSTTQQIFEVTYQQGHYFHLWFGAIAIIAASASLLNAKIVETTGMRAIIKVTYSVQILISLLLAFAIFFDAPPLISFICFLIWMQGNFFQAGLTIGNLNALALEEMGHIAGIATSITASTATLGSALIAIPLASTFNGTPLPIALGEIGLAALALVLSMKITRPSDYSA